MPHLAHSDEACVPTDPSVKTLSDPKDIPESVLTVLKKRIGNVSLPGDPFNPGDVVQKGVPSNRVMFAWNRGTRYLIATERGGRGLYVDIFVYDLDPKSNTATLVSEDKPTSTCESANSLIVKK